MRTVQKKSKEYARCHAAIRRKHGSASKCENPDCTHQNPKRFEWALRKGHQYSPNIQDYIQLCVSCHRKYDFTESQRSAMSRSSPKIRPWHQGSLHEKAKQIDQFDRNGNFIKTWDSINLCATTLGIHNPNIISCLKGRISQTGGFTFKYKIL